MGKNKFEIAILGNGIVAHAAALACAQAGMRVRVDVPAPLPIKREYALNAASVNFLQNLKVWDLIAPHATPVKTMRVFAKAQTELVFDAYQQQVSELAQIVSHQTLASALYTALRLQAQVCADKFSAQDCKQSAEGWQIRDEQGETRAELLVGAEGAQSSLRQKLGLNLGLNAQRKVFAQTAITAKFFCQQAHQGVAYQWLGEAQGGSGIVALLPLPNQQVSLVWSVPNALAQTLLAMNDIEFTAAVQAACHGALGELTMTEPRQSAELFSLTVPTITGSAAVLIGDSAHVVHPLAGQGLNLGLQDAQCLAQVLAHRGAVRSAGDATVLRRYARARALQVRAVLALTDYLGQSNTLQPNSLQPNSLQPNTRQASSQPNLATLAQTKPALELSTLPTEFGSKLKFLGVNFIQRSPLIKRYLVRQASGAAFMYEKL